MIGAAHCCLRESSSLHAIIAGIVIAAVHALAAWCCRDRAVLAPLLVPAAFACPHLIPANKAWLGIWAAFGLLAAALAIGRRRIRGAAAGAADTHAASAADPAPA
jgi:hypothetical protein